MAGTTTIKLVQNTPGTPRVNFAGKYPDVNDTGGIKAYHAIKGSFFITTLSNFLTGPSANLFYFPQRPTPPSPIPVDIHEICTLNIHISQYYCGIQGYQFHKHYNFFITANVNQSTNVNTYEDVYENFNGNTSYVSPPVIDLLGSIVYNTTLKRFQMRISGSFSKGLKSIFKGIYYIY